MERYARCVENFIETVKPTIFFNDKEYLKAGFEVDIKMLT